MKDNIQNDIIETVETLEDEVKIYAAHDEAGEDPQNEYGDDEIDLYVKFKKPYVWEDDTYEGIDLSCLEDLSTTDLSAIEKKYYKLGIASFNPETTAAYAKVTAQKATGLPIEFFDQLPMREMLKIKNRVISFFYN